jgi:hypothetical protein
MSWLDRRRRRSRLSGTGSQSHSSPVTSRTSPARSVATNATVACTASHKIAPAAVSTMPVVRRSAGGAALVRLAPSRPGVCCPGFAARESPAGSGAARGRAARGLAARGLAARRGAGARFAAAIARRLARSAGVSVAEVIDACRTRVGRTGCSPARRELGCWPPLGRGRLSRGCCVVRMGTVRRLVACACWWPVLARGPRLLVACAF